MQPLFTWVLASSFALAATTKDDAPPPGKYDWPQWQGPDRTAISREKGLLQSWPKEGPKLVWEAKGLGGGYSTPSVAAGRIFGMGYKDKDEIVWALNEQDGKEIWSVKIATADKGVGYNDGSRCTPTVDGDKVYVLGVASDLVCLEAATGKEVWRKNLKKDFSGRMMSGWGYSESPLIDGDRLLVTPGGKEATLVALNKKTGEPIWKAKVPQGDGAGYSSIITANVGGKKEYIQFLGKGVVGVSAEGEYLWRFDAPANGTANCSTPIYKDGHVYAASSYNKGGGLAKLTPEGDKVTASEVYFSAKLKNHHGGMVMIGDYLYGECGGRLNCVEFKTGELKWKGNTAGKGSVAFADGRIYYREEGGKGTIVLAEANPDKYVECGRLEQPSRSSKNAWAHPVIANGKLYIRDQDLLLCYDIKAK